MEKLHSILITVLFTLALVGCSQEAHQPETNNRETTIRDGMLQHMVYFYLKEDVTAEEKEQFEEGLKTLLEIEEVYNYQIGIPGPTEERDVTDHSFGYSFSSWFENMEDYKVYAEHPVHLEFIDEYDDLWAEVRVYDSEVIGVQQ